MSTTIDRTPLREVIAMVAADARDLFRGEFALARAEMKSKASRAVMGMIWLVVALVFGLAALMILMLAAVAALSIVMPGWAASLIVAALVLIVAALMARAGIVMLSIDTLLPTRTTNSVSKDAQMIKDHMP